LDLRELDTASRLRIGNEDWPNANPFFPKPISMPAVQRYLTHFQQNPTSVILRYFQLPTTILYVIYSPDFIERFSRLELR